MLTNSAKHLLTTNHSDNWDMLRLQYIRSICIVIVNTVTTYHHYQYSLYIHRHRQYSHYVSSLSIQSICIIIVSVSSESCTISPTQHCCWRAALCDCGRPAKYVYTFELGYTEPLDIRNSLAWWRKENQNDPFIQNPSSSLMFSIPNAGVTAPSCWISLNGTPLYGTPLH